MEPTIDLRANTVSLVLDEGVFARPVGLAAAYRFIDRCYVRLEGRPRGRLQVVLKGKQPIDADGLARLGGDFCNEVVHQAERHRVSERTEALRAAIVGRALMSAEPAGNGSPLQPAGSSADCDYLDDPLGIAVPWEEKHASQNPSKKSGKR